MEIPAALRTDLASLTQAFDDPDIDLDVELSRLTDNLRAAVSSYLGLTLTLGVAERTVTFNVSAGRRSNGAPHVVRASLMLRLAALDGRHVDNTLVLYAATPGAFVDLTADLTFALRLDGSALVLDAHLVPLETAAAGTSGLADLSTVERAVGVLIAQAFTPELARAELTRRAAADGCSVTTTAEHLLAEVTRQVNSGSRTIDPA